MNSSFRLIPSFVQLSLPIWSGVLVWPLSIPPSLPRLLLSTLLCLLGVGVSPAALTSPHRTRNSLTPGSFFGACEHAGFAVEVCPNRLCDLRRDLYDNPDRDSTTTLLRR